MSSMPDWDDSIIPFKASLECGYACSKSGGPGDQ